VTETNPNALSTVLDLEAGLETADERTRGSATGADIAGDMTGAAKMERIEIQHSAGMYAMPGGEQVKKFNGVILLNQRSNSWFDVGLDEDGDGDRRPACFAVDAQTPSTRSRIKQADSCGSCSRNKDAHDRTARDVAWDRPAKPAIDAACGNNLRLCVLVPGCTVPYELRLSASSFKAYDAYVQAIGTRGQFRPFEVVTTFTLKVEDGAKKGVKYSKVQFEMLGSLKPAQRQLVAGARETYREVFLAEAQVATDRGTGDVSSEAREAAAAARAAARSEAARAQGGDDIPF
jgi:hypothetical protein